jgi:hypothetical protein
MYLLIENKLMEKNVSSEGNAFIFSMEQLLKTEYANWMMYAWTHVYI